MNVLDAIRNRRSVGKLAYPAPSDADVQTMLDAAMFAPDHKELRPWRFIVLRDDALNELGDVMAEALIARDPTVTAGQITKERTKPTRAPVIVAIAATHVETSLPFIELICSAAAATQNLLLAAHELGYGAMWRTGDSIYDETVKHWLGLAPSDELVGFVYIGTVAGDTPRRAPIPDDSVVWRPLQLDPADQYTAGRE